MAYLEINYIKTFNIQHSMFNIQVKDINEIQQAKFKKCISPGH
jgi:hypothetical protein